MEWIRRVFLKIRNTIVKLFNKRKMGIDETINRWIDESKALLQGLNLPKCRTDEMILSSISLIDNYLNNVLMILDRGSRLPAMALLRVLGEFVAKLIYCIKGSESGVNERVDSWEKTSLKKRKKFYENIIDRYSGCDHKKIQKWIDKTEDEIDKINVDELPNTADIFEKVFGKKHPVGRAGMYLQYLSAVHLDLETLERTKKRGATGIEYMGDVEYEIEGLKFECLTHVYIFFKHLYEYYNLDFQKIQNEYKILIPKATCS